MSIASAGPVLAAATALVGTPNLALHGKTNADVPTLPAGFPAHLPDKLAWAGSDFSKTSDHILTLSGTHHTEIRAALESYKCGCFPRRRSPPCRLVSLTVSGQPSVKTETSWSLPTFRSRLSARSSRSSAVTSTTAGGSVSSGA